MDRKSKYSVQGFPFKISEKFEFIDNRKYEHVFFISINKFLTLKYIIPIVVIIMIIGVTLFVIRRKKIVYFDLQE